MWMGDLFLLDTVLGVGKWIKQTYWVCYVFPQCPKVMGRKAWIIRKQNTQNRSGNCFLNRPKLETHEILLWSESSRNLSKGFFIKFYFNIVFLFICYVSLLYYCQFQLLLKDEGLDFIWIFPKIDLVFRKSFPWRTFWAFLLSFSLSVD